MPTIPIHDISRVPVGGKLRRSLAGQNMDLWVAAIKGNLVFAAPYPPSTTEAKSDITRQVFEFEAWGWYIFEANTGIELDDVIGPTVVSVACPAPE